MDELLQNIKKDMEIYLDGMLLKNFGSTLNFNDSTFTMKDMKHMYDLVNTPREVTFKIDNAKVDQFQLAQIMGIKFIEAELIKEYKQYRTHKKKRINKKWLKGYGTYPVYDDNVYMVNGTLIGSPVAISEIREACKIS